MDRSICNISWIERETFLRMVKNREEFSRSRTEQGSRHETDGGLLQSRGNAVTFCREGSVF